MPNSFYEVEHSTDIYNSLLKYNELQDFRANVVIVADTVRKREYEEKLSQVAFSNIQKRVQYLDYEKLSEMHTKIFEYYTTKEILDFGIVL
jgi:hypothetical protein